MVEYRVIRIFGRPLGDHYTPYELIRVFRPEDEAIPYQNDTYTQEFTSLGTIEASDQDEAVRLVARKYGGWINDEGDVFTYFVSDVVDIDDVYNMEDNAREVAAIRIDRESILEPFHEQAPEADRLWVRWDGGYYSLDDDALIDEIVRRILQARMPAAELDCDEILASLPELPDCQPGRLQEVHVLIPKGTPGAETILEYISDYVHAHVVEKITVIGDPARGEATTIYQCGTAVFVLSDVDRIYDTEDEDDMNDLASFFGQEIVSRLRNE